MKLVFFGDSVTAFRGELKVASMWFEEWLPQAAVVNAGVPGNTTAMARERFAADVLACGPDVAVISFGINDSAIDTWDGKTEPRVPLEAYAANLTAMVRELGKKVVMFTPPPLYMTDELFRLYGMEPFLSHGFNFMLDRYLDAMRRVAEAEGCLLADVNAEFRRLAGGDGPELMRYSLDGMHPNAAGQEIIAGLLRPLIDSSR